MFCFSPKYAFIVWIVFKLWFDNLVVCFPSLCWLWRQACDKCLRLLQRIIFATNSAKRLGALALMPETEPSGVDTETIDAIIQVVADLARWAVAGSFQVNQLIYFVRIPDSLLSTEDAALVSIAVACGRSAPGKPCPCFT